MKDGSWVKRGVVGDMREEINVNNKIMGQTRKTMSETDCEMESDEKGKR